MYKFKDFDKPGHSDYLPRSMKQSLVWLRIGKPRTKVHMIHTLSQEIMHQEWNKKKSMKFHFFCAYRSMMEDGKTVDDLKGSINPELFK